MNCIATNVECENAIIKKDSIGRQKTYCGITNKMITSKSSCPKQLGGKEKPMAKGFIKNAFYKDPMGKRFMFVRCVEMMAKSGQEMVANIGIYEGGRDIPEVLEIPYDVLQCVEVEGDGFKFVGGQSTVNSYDKELFDELEKVKKAHGSLSQRHSEVIEEKKNVEKKLEIAEKRADEVEKENSTLRVECFELQEQNLNLIKEVDGLKEDYNFCLEEVNDKQSVVDEFKEFTNSILSLIPFELKATLIKFQEELECFNFDEELTKQKAKEFEIILKQWAGIIEEEECDLKEYAEIAAKKVILQAIKDLAKLTND